MRLFGWIFFSVGALLLVGGALWVAGVTEGDGTQDPEWFIGPLVFGFAGLLFGGIGGGVLWSIRRQRIKRETLMRTGRKIACTVTNIFVNTHIRVNNRHPVRVECRGEVSGKEMTFSSHNVYGSLALNVGDPVDVYLDFRNPDQYWVEIPKDAVRF